VRLPLLAALLLLFGLPGLPAAAIMTAATSALIIQRRSIRELSGVATPLWPPSVAMLLRLGLLAIGGLLAVTVFAPSWLYVLIVGGTVALVGAFLLIVTDPLLRDELLSWARRPRPVRRSTADDL
jgi:hypothetical protein